MYDLYCWRKKRQPAKASSSPVVNVCVRLGDLSPGFLASVSAKGHQEIHIFVRNLGGYLKPRVVLSGVNLNEMGLLAVFKEALAWLAAEYADSYEIIALVHRKDLFDIPNVSYLEYPDIKSSWFKRVRFEYRDCRALSEALKPHLWLSMHDVTPNVQAQVRAVYCHNATPFYPFNVKDALLDWKFGAFNLFYQFLYGINIKSNDFVVVQQDWLRTEFQSRYGVRNVVVAHPSVDPLPIGKATVPRDLREPYRFFYPAYPRPFKNVEQILNAARRLEQNNFKQFEIWLTMDGSETRYAAKMCREYSDLATVRWMGILPRAEVLRLYDQTDCLLFPSMLETWGMPITEFAITGKPILAVDLPYAHETVGDYGKTAFFARGDEIKLASMMQQAASGVKIFTPHSALPVAEPFCRNWKEFWAVLLEPVTEPLLEPHSFTEVVQVGQDAKE